MKILNIMLGKKRGGLEQAALDYTVGLSKQGAQVLFVTAPEAAINKQVMDLQLPYTCLYHLGSWDAWAAWKLHKIAKRFGANVMIAHGNRALCIASLANSAIPIVAVAHNYQLQHLGKADSVFCITHHVMNAVQTAHTALYHHCYFMPNMIANVDIKPKAAFAAIPRIGAMGRLVAKKGFDVWLRSLALLRDKNIAFSAVLAGDGEEKEALLWLRNELCLQEVVEFKGWVECKETFYNEIEIFCVPSHHEPFGIVIIEAMARGVPIISTASEGAVEILADSAHGAIVEKNNPEAMANALAMLLSNPGDVLAMGQRGRNYVRESYGMEVRSEAMLSVLKTIIASEKA